MEIQFELINDFGNFKSEVINCTDEEYLVIKEMSKNYYETGFELTDDSGNFIVFTPDVIKKSILKIKIIKNYEE